MGRSTAERPYSNSEAAARQPVHLAASIEPVQGLYAPFLHTFKASGPEFGTGIKYAVERGWLELHESGTYVRLKKTAQP